MPATEDSPEALETQRRIWSDPYFYAALGTIGGTYVILVLGMLLADAAYIFTSDLQEQVTLDFAASGSRQAPFQVGDIVTDQFADYGLSITSHAPKEHPVRIIDSSKPSAANSDLGTPHQSYGGPGFGSESDRERERHSNSLPLGKVLVIASHGNEVTVDKTVGELVHTWAHPVQIRSISITPNETLADRSTHQPDDMVRVLGYTDSRNAPQSTTFALDDAGQGKTELDWSDIIRVDIQVPDRESIAHIDFDMANSSEVDLGTTRRKRLELGNVRLVPAEAGDVRPRAEGGTFLFQWQDEVDIKTIQLLDVDADGGLVTAYDLQGTPLGEWPIENSGPNTVQDILLAQQRVGQLKIDVPSGAAVAEVQFSWKRRVRAAWERDYPALARCLYNPITFSLQQPEIRSSIWLTLISCTISAILSLWVAVPIGYLMSRHDFWGRAFIDALLDIPIVLPPLVVGLSLLILFQYLPTAFREAVIYEKPAVVIAQFAVACAFAVRTMRATFDQIDFRREHVALTLGCSRAQAFGMVVLPEASRGMMTAATLAWARSLGEFGPLLILAGTTRNKTEVLSTTVFLEISIGDLGAAVAVSLIMVFAAIVVLVLARFWGTRRIAI